MAPILHFDVSGMYGRWQIYFEDVSWLMFALNLLERWSEVPDPASESNSRLKQMAWCWSFNKKNTKKYVSTIKSAVACGISIENGM